MRLSPRITCVGIGASVGSTASFSQEIEVRRVPVLSSNVTSICGNGLAVSVTFQPSTSLPDTVIEYRLSSHALLGFASENSQRILYSFTFVPRFGL